MKFKYSVLFLFLFVFASMILCAENDNHLQDFLVDWQIGFLGCLPVTEKTDTFIRNLIKELGLPFNETIRIRKLSKFAIYHGMTKKFACVFSCGSNFSPYLFISESWFNKLSLEKKRFLIAHELMHLKYNHQQISSNVDLLSFFGIGAAVFIALQNEVSFYKQLFGSYFIANFFSSLISSYVSKKHEYEADCQAVIHLNSKQGSYRLFRDFIRTQKKWEKELPQWKIMKWLRTIESTVCQTFFGTHPTCQQRIRMLRALKLKEKIDSISDGEVALSA